MKIIKYLFCFCFILLALSNYAQSPVLKLIVPNVESAQGDLQVSIFNNDKTFLKEKEEYRIYRFKVEKDSDVFTIDDLPQGEYAMIIFHDKNSNKDLDRSFLGIPKEGYGFSNNIKPHLSAPDFRDCCFSLVKDTKIEIELLY
ncbi:DUF2141 domain-containing protein [Mangrovibacterium diazotrophicum]|uniref:Uncharacterized protein (DUF2141 family) n=1 Tax=Mangrovibacterium diazotrophicum TaxID=1261403 RepID=A0A419W5Y3_9BACT|nr:DUF2141 domain-containing protein [Mangrovibacterium diazotrophicum]RKD90857.1 uncharacterized protein (DUF2141 family) [Mangrovibacterium diazotrophicum]